MTLYAGDEKIGEGDMPKTVPVAFTSYAGMDVGRDNGLVVDRAYEDKAPYAFTGTIRQVVFDLQPVDPDTELALHRHAAVQAVGGGRSRRMSEVPDLEALLRLPADQPVVMVNLMKFHPGEGRDHYARYVAAATRICSGSGGPRLATPVTWARRPGGGAVWWDAVLLVEYPTPQAFVDMVSDPGYRDAHRLRNAALERHELIATTVWSPGGEASPETV